MTILLLAVGIGLAVVASLGDSVRRRAPLAWHAYVPWHGLVFVGGVMALLAAVHLFSLARAAG